MSDVVAPSPEPSRRQWAGFWCMIVQQTLNAFNDKMSQFILIPLAGAVGMSVESAAGLMIALPFVLLAPIAGWLSDRFSKRDVMIGSAVLQVGVLSWICVAVMIHQMPLALAGFFALAVQAAFFSPAKIGINKELVGSNHLGFATGIQQMTAMLAMLVGQIVAGGIFDRRYHALGASPEVAWQAALGPLFVLTILALPVVLLAWIIPRVPAQGGGKFTPRLAVAHFINLADLWRDVPLRRASFGVAFFWGFAGFINLWSVKLAKDLTGGGEGFGTLSSIFMAAASLGMAGGFGFAAWLLRRRIELGWVPVAGVAMTLSSFALVWIVPGGGWFLAVLALLAFVSALFLAPLNAWMQDRYPAAKRGELQAAANLQDCFAGIIAVLFVTGLEYGAGKLGIAALTGLRVQMLLVAVCCGLATLLIIRLLPAHFIRVIGVAIVRSIYHIRVVHDERVPDRGGVLLLPNHVTYADAFFLSAACHRPVRFVMDDVFMANRAIRVFTTLFETMPIRRDQPLEAIREIIRALQQGEVVCLFPEGQLTRTGTLCPLQRGFELIARKTTQPVIPVWCDGSWGSIFSFERNRYFRKLPRRLKLGILVAFGNPLEPAAINLPAARVGLLDAAVEALGQRVHDRGWANRQARRRNAAAVAFNAGGEAAIARWWANGYQIGNVNALQRGQTFHILADDPLITALPGLLVAFPELFGGRLCIEPVFRGEACATWVGGDVLRAAVQATAVAGTIDFYDFGTRALEPVNLGGVNHYPCLAVAATVVAMSMPDPVPADDNFAPQRGRQAGTWGRLLPGWQLTTRAGQVMAHGPAASAEGLPLPGGTWLDDDGFVVSRQCG